MAIRGRPTRGRMAEIAERREIVAAMLAQGVPQAVIAERLGHSRQTITADALHVVQKRTSELNEYADQIIAKQTAELEAIREKAWQVVRTKHYQITKEGTVAKDDEGRALLDTAPNVSAMQLLLKVQEREARMLGTDQPKKIDVNAQVVTLDLVKASVLEMRRQVAELEGP